MVVNKDVPMKELPHGSSRKVLAWSENVMTAEVYFEEGGYGELHTHPHEQITYVVEGQIEYEIEGEKYLMNPGDSIYVAPNLVHGLKALKKSKVLDVFTPMREDFLEK